MHHAQHSLPLQCRKSKKQKRKERETQERLANVHTLFTIYSYHTTLFIDIAVEIFHLPTAVIWDHQCMHVGYINLVHTAWSVQVRDGSCSKWQWSGVWGLMLTFHYTGECVVHCAVIGACDTGTRGSPYIMSHSGGKLRISSLPRSPVFVSICISSKLLPTPSVVFFSLQCLL